MKKLLIIIFILFIGCNYTINETMSTFKKYPNWVETIRNGEIIKEENYVCFSTKLNSKSFDEGKKEIKKSLFSQISNSIISQVNSNIFSTSSTIDNNYQKFFQQKLNVKSVTTLKGINLDDYYYDDLTSTAYGYICIPKYKFNSLVRENETKQREFLEKLEQLTLFINKGEKEKALMLFKELRFKYSPFFNEKLAESFKNRINNMINFSIQLDKMIFTRSTLIAHVYVDKPSYLTVILDEKKFLLKNKLLNKGYNKVLIISYVNNSLKGLHKLEFLLSPTLLMVDNYTVNNEVNKLVKEYIINYQRINFLAKKEKTIKIKKTKNLCITFLGDIKNELKDEIENNNCMLKYRLYVKPILKKKNTYFVVKVKFILQKDNNNILSHTKYLGIFKDKDSIKDYLIPIIKNKREELLKSIH